MQIASSDFSRDEGKNGENPLWIFEYFSEISRRKYARGGIPVAFCRHFVVYVERFLPPSLCILTALFARHTFFALNCAGALLAAAGLS